MNNLEELLRPLVEKAISGIEKGVDFAIEQAPLLVQEFYNWHIAETVIYLVISVILLSIPYVMYRLDKKYDFSNEIILFPVFVSLVSFLIGVIMFVAGLLDLVKLIVAPRLYLIEYFLN
tara:strand:+ start:353 stop:709 length:357 start_codon:yes stop_codon:yes gene_type:complete